MRRHIRRGSRGIALLDNSRGKPALRYVFDVADTDRKDEKALNPNLWQYREEHQDAVTAALEGRFEVSGANGLLDSWSRSPYSWRKNTGPTISTTSSISLTAPFWRSMMNSTSKWRSEAPPPSASPMP